MMTKSFLLTVIELNKQHLLHGDITPEEAFQDIQHHINLAYYEYINGNGKPIDKRDMLHKAFVMLAKVTK